MVHTGGGGLRGWGMFIWHILGTLVVTDHRLNAFSILADHFPPFLYDHREPIF